MTARWRQPDLFAGASAVFSEDRRYRYALMRGWGVGDRQRRATWICHNPSDASEYADDPTVRKIIGFTERLDCTAFTLRNLYAFVATDPKDLHAAADPIGPENDSHLGIVPIGPVVLAWGACRDTARQQAVLAILARNNVRPLCLGRTKDGQPRHPLYLSYTTAFEPYVPPAGV